MTSLAEAQPNAAFMRGPLAEGVTLISQSATLTFTKYVRRVLPIDGYVFWLAGEQMQVTGALHYSAQRHQNEDETLSVNQIVFTTNTPIAPFNVSDPQTLWLSTVDGVQFTFSQRGMFFDPAGLYHYAGDAVYPALASQLVANLDTLPNTTQIVSNSLPAWLQIVDYSPIWLLPPNPGIQLYPSFLVPSDLQPPYGAVHIEPSATYAYQAQPNFSATMSHYQLAYDRVRITLYGTTNDQAASFLDVVNQYSLDTDLIGMVGMPLIRDEKRGQVELQALAMKKTIEFEVSYLQTSMRNLARQLIKQATVAFTVSPFPT